VVAGSDLNPAAVPRRTRRDADRETLISASPQSRAA
jgi:hypothetical protein